jgi:ubiquinone/menaquinone biosynthesis C-methylase UbiE
MTTTSATESIPTSGKAKTGHVCPWWIGWLLASPVRRLLDDASPLLEPLARPGMTVLEPGPGMGYFSLKLARLVGPTGRVVCVDLQPKMIAGLERRARRSGLAERVEGLAGTLDHPSLEPRAATFDLAVAIYMVHEVPDQEGFLRRIATLLRPGGRLLIVEPKGHVTPDSFAATIKRAEAAGLRALPRPEGRQRFAALLERPPA